jgi:histidinol phosphatase-like enzyme (inositol monophosphatase family)
MNNLLDEVVDIAREAGHLVLRYYRADIKVERKPDNSPVTLADQKAEEMIAGRLNRSFPEDGIVGEEHGRHEGGSRRIWTIDPIDGTKAFIHGVPFFGTAIGLLEDDKSVLGVIHLPALNETVAAARGVGCYWNGQPARVSSVDCLEDALMVSSHIRGIYRLGLEERFKELLMRVWMYRTWGDCHGYVLVATGRAEICFDTGAKLWDTAPLPTIIEEAGGRFTSLTGEETVYGKTGLATNNLLHEKILGYLRTDHWTESE